MPRVNGPLLKQLIDQKDLTQGVVARYANITPGALSKILHGHVRNSASSTVDALADCLGVRRSEIVVDPVHDPDPRAIDELRSVVAQSSGTQAEALRPRWGRKSRLHLAETYVRVNVSTPHGEVDAVEHLVIKASRSASRTSLLGPPGAGKTTAARMAALSLATAEGNAGPLPVPLPMRRLCGTDEAIWACVESHYKIRGLGEALERLAARGGLVLLLDGFDEVPDPIAALRAVQRASRDAGINPIILTSRVEGYRSPNSDFEECELLPLDRAQQEELFLKWLPEDDRARRTLDQLSAPHLDGIQRSPLLLTILASLLRADPRQALPSGTIELLAAYRTMLIRRLHAPPGEEGAVVDEARISLVVKTVAARSSQRGDDTFSRLDFLDWLETAPVTENHRGDELLAQVLQTGLIVSLPERAPIAGGDYQFLHRIVRDAIAAEYYAESCPDDSSPSEEWLSTLEAVLYLHPSTVSFTASVLGVRHPKRRDALLARLLQRLRAKPPVNRDPRDARFSLIAETSRVGYETLVDFLKDEHALVHGDASLKNRRDSEVLNVCLQGLLDDARRYTESSALQFTIERVLDIARLVAQETTDGNDLWVLKEILDEVIQWEAQGNGREKRRFIPSRARIAVAGHMARNLLAYPDQRRRERSLTAGNAWRVRSARDAGEGEPALAAAGLVTNGEFARFDPDHRERLRGEHAVDSDLTDEAPAVMVSWFEAALFAKFVGGRLPWPEELDGSTGARTNCVVPSCEWTAAKVTPSFSKRDRTSVVWGSCYERPVGNRPASPSSTRLARGRDPDITFRVVFPDGRTSRPETLPGKGDGNA